MKFTENVTELLSNIETETKKLIQSKINSFIKDNGFKLNNCYALKVKRDDSVDNTNILINVNDDTNVFYVANIDVFNNKINIYNMDSIIKNCNASNKYSLSELNEFLYDINIEAKIREIESVKYTWVVDCPQSKHHYKCEKLFNKKYEAYKDMKNHALEQIDLDTTSDAFEDEPYIDVYLRFQEEEITFDNNDGEHFSYKIIEVNSQD